MLSSKSMSVILLCLNCAILIAAQVTATPNPVTSTAKPLTPEERFVDFSCTGTEYYIEHASVSTVMFVISFCVMILSTVVVLFSCCFHMFMKEMAIGK